MTRLPAIFVVGASRSGTTMLNSVLSRHPRILGLNELHFFGARWDPASDEVWALGRARDESARLLAVARRSIWGTPASSEEVAEARSLIGDTEHASPAEVYARTLNYLREKAGADFVVDQTPRNIMYAGRLAELFPDAYFVQMVRDPRAVLYSQRNRWRQRWLGAGHTPLRNSLRVFVNYHAITASKLWSRAIAAGGQMAAESRFHRLRFEGFVAEPEAGLQTLCSFLGVDFQPAMLDVPKVGSSNERHDAESRGISADVASRWQGRLPMADCFLCQRMTRREREQFGYADIETGWPVFGLLWRTILFPIHLFGALLLNPRLALAMARSRGSQQQADDG